MSIISGDELLKGGMDHAVELMAVAANTVLKFGPTRLKMSAIGPEEFEELSGYCEGVAEVSPLFNRDGRSFKDMAKEDTRALLIGARRKSVYNFDCGACGFATCKELNKAEEVESFINGPCCHFAIYDAHMAANAAAAVAHYMGLHCRVFITIGVSAHACEFLEDVDFAVGVGVSYQSKNPFFDRHKYWTDEEWAQKFAEEFPSFSRGFIGAEE
ncbi:MAG: DUF2148 domain-containing protein [Actinomycetota bacterium]